LGGGGHAERVPGGAYSENLCGRLLGRLLLELFGLEADYRLHQLTCRVDAGKGCLVHMVADGRRDGRNDRASSIKV
jgi:hypothetical protein